MKSEVFTPRRGAMAALSLALSIILPAAPGLAAGTVDDAALKDMKQSENWLSYGRNYSMQRYSPLEQINSGNAGKLGLEWSMALPDDRSLLATPLVVDGVMYFTGTCVWCHSAGAVSGGYAPDLRASLLFLKKDTLRKVLDGSLVKNGMPKYAELTDADLEALQHYVRNQAIVTTQQAKK